MARPDWFDTKLILPLIELLLALGFIASWIRSRFWLPAYAHALAAVGLAVGIWTVVSIPANVPMSHGSSFTKFLLALALPAMVYAFFILHGGQRAAIKRRFKVTVPCPHCKLSVAAFKASDDANAPITVYASRKCVHCGSNFRPQPEFD